MTSFGRSEVAGTRLSVRSIHQLRSSQAPRSLCLTAKVAPASATASGRELALQACEMLTGLARDTLSFCKTDLKQPFIQSQDGVLPCSISHAAGVVAAVAATKELELGIDVDQTSRFASASLNLVDEILSPAEQRLRSEWPEVALQEVWSLKEAFVKSQGTGFRSRPNTYELAHLKADVVHKLDDGLFWQYIRYPLEDGFWVTLGATARSSETLANWAHNHKMVQLGDVL